MRSPFRGCAHHSMAFKLDDEVAVTSTPTAWLLLVTLVHAATAQETAPRTWSGLTVMPCDESKEAQKFSALPSSEGRIADKSTGRCITVLDCALPSPVPAMSANQMGVAVLDACGGPTCGSASQRWSIEPSGTPGASELVSPLHKAADTSWRVQGTFSPPDVDNHYVVVAQISAGTHYKNTEFTPGASGSLKLTPTADGDGTYRCASVHAVAYCIRCRDPRLMIFYISSFFCYVAFLTDRSPTCSQMEPIAPTAKFRVAAASRLCLASFRATC
jgi:hypothetical protein